MSIHCVAPNPIYIFQRKILLYPRNDKSQSQKKSRDCSIRSIPTQCKILRRNLFIVSGPSLGCTKWPACFAPHSLNYFLLLDGYSPKDCMGLMLLVSKLIINAIN